MNSKRRKAEAELPEGLSSRISDTQECMRHVKQSVSLEEQISDILSFVKSRRCSVD